MFDVDDIRGAIEQLPDDERELIVMKYWHNMDCGRIAKATGIQTPTVAKLLRCIESKIENIVTSNRCTPGNRGQSNAR
jgi:DNA-directed RNA polymerase specialized sigma24 family protein